MSVPLSRLTLTHLVLTLVAALVLSACLADSGATLAAPAAFDQAKAGSITLIDIRTPGEWRQTGVAGGAVAINMQDPQGAEGFADKVLAQVKGDRGAPIALICRSGNRSTHMQHALQELGFTRVYNVNEGMGGSAAGPGWIKRGLPVAACKQC